MAAEQLKMQNAMVSTSLNSTIPQKRNQKPQSSGRGVVPNFSSTGGAMGNAMLINQMMMEQNLQQH